MHGPGKSDPPISTREAAEQTPATGRGGRGGKGTGQGNRRAASTGRDSESRETVSRRVCEADLPSMINAIRRPFASSALCIRDLLSLLRLVLAWTRADHHRTEGSHSPPEAVGKVPLVTALVVTFNHRRYIGAALDSVLGQSTTFPVEIIVSEDASTDGTRDIVLDLLAGIRTRSAFCFRIVTSGRTRWSRGD